MYSPAHLAVYGVCNVVGSSQWSQQVGCAKWFELQRDSDIDGMKAHPPIKLPLPTIRLDPVAKIHFVALL